MNNEREMTYNADWAERIRWRLFPNAMVDNPEMHGGHDCIVSRVRVELSFLDRLRVLISGRAEIVVKTTTENVVGWAETNSSFSARPPRWLSRRGANFMRGEGWNFNPARFADVRRRRLSCRRRAAWRSYASGRRKGKG